MGDFVSSFFIAVLFFGAALVAALLVVAFVQLVAFVFNPIGVLLVAMFAFVWHLVYKGMNEA